MAGDSQRRVCRTSAERIIFMPLEQCFYPHNLLSGMDVLSKAPLFQSFDINVPGHEAMSLIT